MEKLSNSWKAGAKVEEKGIQNKYIRGNMKRNIKKIGKRLGMKGVMEGKRKREKKKGEGDTLYI